MKSQQLSGVIILALVIVIGLLVYDREYRHETIGEKVGHSIDRAADKMEEAADKADTRH